MVGESILFYVGLLYCLQQVTSTTFIEWCEEATERRRFSLDKCIQYPFVYPYPDCYCLNGIAIVKVAHDSRPIREINFGKSGCFSHKALGAPNRTIELLPVEFTENDTLVGYEKSGTDASFEFVKVPSGATPKEFPNNTLVIYNGELFDTNEDYNDKTLYCIQKNSNQDTAQQVRYYQLFPETYIWLNETCNGGNYIDLELISAGKLLTESNHKCIPKCGNYDANAPIRVPTRKSGFVDYSNSEEFGLEKSCKPIPNHLRDLHKDLNERILKHSIERSFYDQQSYKIDYKPSYSFKIMELLSKITSKYCRHARIPNNFFEQALDYFKVAHEGRGFYFSEDFSFADYSSISRMLRRCLFYMNETIQFTSEGCGVKHNIKSVFRDSPKVDAKEVHPSATHQYFDHHVVLDIPWNMLDLANVVCVNAFSKSYRMYHWMEQGIERLFTNELRSFWLYPDVPNFYYENLYGPYWRSFARNLEKCVDSAYMYNPKMARLIRPQWIPGNQRSSRRRGTIVDPICERRRTDLELISQNYEIYCASPGIESEGSGNADQLANMTIIDWPNADSGNGGYTGSKPLIDFPDYSGGSSGGYTGSKPLMDFPDSNGGPGNNQGGYTGNKPLMDFPDKTGGPGNDQGGYTGNKPLMDFPDKTGGPGNDQGGYTGNKPLIDFPVNNNGGSGSDQGGYTGSKPLIDFPENSNGGNPGGDNGNGYTGKKPLLDFPHTGGEGNQGDSGTEPADAIFINFPTKQNVPGATPSEGGNSDDGSDASQPIITPVGVDTNGVRFLDLDNFPVVEGPEGSEGGGNAVVGDKSHENMTDLSDNVVTGLNLVDFPVIEGPEDAASNSGSNSGAPVGDQGQKEDSSVGPTPEKGGDNAGEGVSADGSNKNPENPNDLGENIPGVNLFDFPDIEVPEDAESNSGSNTGVPVDGTDVTQGNNAGSSVPIPEDTFENYSVLDLTEKDSNDGSEAGPGGSLGAAASSGDGGTSVTPVQKPPDSSSNGGDQATSAGAQKPPTSSANGGDQATSSGVQKPPTSSSNGGDQSASADAQKPPGNTANGGDQGTSAGTKKPPGNGANSGDQSAPGGSVSQQKPDENNSGSPGAEASSGAITSGTSSQDASGTKKEPDSSSKQSTEPPQPLPENSEGGGVNQDGGSTVVGGESSIGTPVEESSGSENNNENGNDLDNLPTLTLPEDNETGNGLEPIDPQPNPKPPGSSLPGEGGQGNENGPPDDDSDKDHVYIKWPDDTPSSDDVYLKWPQGNGNPEDPNQDQVYLKWPEEPNNIQPNNNRAAFLDDIDPIANNEEEVPDDSRSDIYKRHIYPNQQQGPNQMYDNSYPRDFNGDPGGFYQYTPDNTYTINDVGNEFSLDRYDPAEGVIPYRRSMEPELLYSQSGRGASSVQPQSGSLDYIRWPRKEIDPNADFLKWSQKETDPNAAYLKWPQKRNDQNNVYLNRPRTNPLQPNPGSGESVNPLPAEMPFLDFPDYDPVPKPPGNEQNVFLDWKQKNTPQPTSLPPSPKPPISPSPSPPVSPSNPPEIVDPPNVPTPNPNQNVFIDWKRKNEKATPKPPVPVPVSNIFLDWKRKNDQASPNPPVPVPVTNTFLDWKQKSNSPGTPSVPNPKFDTFLDWKHKGGSPGNPTVPNPKYNTFLDWKPKDGSSGNPPVHYPKYDTFLDWKPKGGSPGNPPVPYPKYDTFLDWKPQGGSPGNPPVPYPKYDTFLDWKPKGGSPGNPSAPSPKYDTFLDWKPPPYQQTTTPQPKPVTGTNKFLDWKPKDSQKLPAPYPERPNTNVFIEWQPKSKQIPPPNKAEKDTDNSVIKEASERQARNVKADVSIDYPEAPLFHQPSTTLRNPLSQALISTIPETTSVSYYRPIGTKLLENLAQVNVKPKPRASGKPMKPLRPIEFQPKGDNIKPFKRESMKPNVTNRSTTDDSSYPRFPKNSLMLDTYNPVNMQLKCPLQHSFSPVSNNCTHFYTCIPDSDSEDQLLMLMLKCRSAMHFDPKLQDCIPGDCLQLEFASPRPESLKVKYSAVKVQTGRAEEFRANCTSSKKMLPIAGDCRNYLVCSNIYGEWYVNKYQCPESTYFHESSGCVEGACQ